MKIQIVQDVIDLLRNKKGFSIVNHAQKPSNFEDRLKTLIKNCIPYYYTDFKIEQLYQRQIPDFNEYVYTEQSLMKNIKNYKFAIKELKRRYNINQLKWTYDNLADGYSREIFLWVIVHKILGCGKVRFPLAYSESFDKLDYLNKLKIDNEELQGAFSIFNKFNLNKIGYDVKLFTDKIGIIVAYLLEQYAYKNIVKAQEGDYVIDGGSCYGDISLYFADKVKKNGKVFAFEFVKDNLESFNKNLQLNPQYKNNIVIVKKAISGESNQKLYVEGIGPASKIINTAKDGADEVFSITLDDFVKENQIEKIDFIKLDIEGCELEALKGAAKILKQFKPKLAISIYHKDEDLWQIPQYIKSIVPEYDLYIKQLTVVGWETVLYAKCS